jgi:hypothetical protein
MFVVYAYIQIPLPPELPSVLTATPIWSVPEAPVWVERVAVEDWSLLKESAFHVMMFSPVERFAAWLPTIPAGTPVPELAP